MGEIYKKMNKIIVWIIAIVILTIYYLKNHGGFWKNKDKVHSFFIRLKEKPKKQTEEIKND